MRSDLHEVLIERPRSGQRRKTDRSHKPRVGEWTGEDDSYAHSYRPRRLRTKYFDDLLSPLRRWLRKQVDRPWDKVWSELANGIDSRTVVGRHLLDHVRGLVTIDCRYDTQLRRVIHLPHRVYWRRRDEEVTGLFVDPRSGLLRWKAPPLREHLLITSENPPDTLLLPDQRFALKRNGIWFAADVVFLALSQHDRTPFDFRWNGYRCCIRNKQQLDSRTLRELGLENDNDA
ncbi:hypothetical protein ACFJIW_03150 [Tahibacter sp. UC22_41]|uniref:hypothetical protein n=1 Tax=Tahibacter sp. UC22_41 TaxID=3350178 RepID=UPI0036DA2C7E